MFRESAMAATPEDLETAAENNANQFSKICVEFGQAFAAFADHKGN